MIAIAIEEMSIIHRVTCEGVAQIRKGRGNWKGRLRSLIGLVVRNYQHFESRGWDERSA